MRVLSWIVVLGSVAWLIAGTMGFRPDQIRLPAMQDQQLSGTAAPDLELTSSEQTSSVSYASVYPLLETLDQVEELDRVDAVLSIRSILPGVAPEDLEFLARDGFRTYVFKPGPDGSLVLPVRQDWLDSGMVLESNQPLFANGSATYSMSLSLSFVRPPATTVDYAWLWESVEQMRKSMAALPGHSASDRSSVRGIVVQFEPEAKGAVTVRAGEFTRSYQAGPDGQVHLPVNDELRQRNATVVFSDLAVALGPWVP